MPLSNVPRLTIPKHDRSLPLVPPSPTSAMDSVTIRANMSDLLHCLNSRDFHLLALFLAPTTVTVNGSPMSAATYARSLQLLVASAPDMVFRLGQIVINAPSRRVACTFAIECTPRAGRNFRGHQVGDSGKKVRYFEQAAYRLNVDGRIEAVESSVDDEAVAKQCRRIKKKV